MVELIMIGALGFLSIGLTAALISAQAVDARWKSDASYWQRQHSEQAQFIREIKIGLFKEAEFARLQLETQRALARTHAAEMEACKWRRQAAEWRDLWKSAAPISFPEYLKMANPEAGD